MQALRVLGILAALGIFLIPATSTQAQHFSIGIGVGPVVVAHPPVYYGPPPVCAYGYYPDAPYACAPYGYYGPEWFENGIFLGVGPWYGWGWRHGWDRDDWGRFHRDFDDRREFWGRRDFYDHDRGWHGRGHFDGDFHGDRGFHGGREFHGGGGFHGGEGFHGGGGFHGEGGFHGGGYR